MNKFKKYLPRISAIILALLLWQVLAVIINESIFLVGPLAVALRFFALLGEGEFWTALGFSFLRIACGFFAGVLLGILLGGLAGRFPVIETLLYPYTVTVRSVPVASFAVLALLWFSHTAVSAFISFLIVLPLVYNAVLEGVRNLDPQMREMASVFGFSPLSRLHLIWIPGIRPFLLSSVKVAVGLAWKSGIAAELIGVPRHSLGELLYNAKIYMDTAELFAVTAVIILCTVLCEKTVLALMRRLLGERRRNG